MDAEARKEEILAKKAKLEELRRARALREQEMRTKRQSVDPNSDVLTPTPNRDARQRDIEKLLTDVLGESRSASPGAVASPRRGSRSRPGSTVSSSRPLSDERRASTQRMSSETGEARESRATGMSTVSGTTYVASATQTLGIAPTVSVYEQPSDAPPKKEIVTYDKGIQTSVEWQPQRKERGVGRGGEDGEAEEDWGGRETPRPLSESEKERLREELRREIEEEVKAAVQPGSIQPTEEARFPARTLSNDELEAVTTSRDFQDFLDQSTKVIERALDEEYDLLTDYAHGKTNLDEDDEGYSTRGKRGRRVRQVAQYWDERWSKKRQISDIGFSPKYPELLLASYTKNPSAPHEAAGLLQVWNAHMPSRPEYVFHASSDILTAKFSPFHPSLIVGGCYSGQVLLWDTRSKSPSPVQKTPLTGSGHTHPVYSIDIVGTQNANNIISCSTDGVVCSWSVDMLAQPQEYLELVAPSPPAKTEDVAPLCMGFPHADPTYFLAGTEEGTIFACHRYERAGAKAGIDNRIRYSGHAAPVMSLDFHPSRGAVDLGDLVLSASMDWSVRLWRVRPPAATGGAAVSGQAHIQSPVLDFSREDLVFDVKWSPVRPGVFALVDGAGALEIWDLNADHEIPIAHVTPTEHTNTASLAGGLGMWKKRSLNRCAWEQNEGKKIAVGGLDGVITVFEVGNELGGTEGARAEEWTGVKKVVARAEAQLGAAKELGGAGSKAPTVNGFGR